MKKIIYSLVIMIAAGSLFTSCIDQVEPVGILDMRTAKAEYIRALKDLRAADAEYRRAEAAVQLANAAYRQAETAWMQEQVNNQKLLNELQALKNEAEAMDNELKAAEVAKKIADLENAMEEAAAQHAINMVNLENNLAKAEEDLRVSLRNIALSAQELTAEERQVIQEAANYYWKAYEEVAEQTIAVMKAQRLVDSLKEAKVRFADKDWDNTNLAYTYKVDLWQREIDKATADKAKQQALKDKAPKKVGDKYPDVKEWKETLDELKKAKEELAYSKHELVEEISTYYVNYVHDGYKAFNQAAEAWKAENVKPSKDELSHADSVLIEEGVKEPEDFKKANAKAIDFPALTRTQVGNATIFNKYAFLLSSYNQPSPVDFTPKKNFIVNDPADSLKIPAVNQAMKAFILGAADAGENSQVLKDKDGKKIATASYGLKGAYSILERELVSDPDKAPTAEKIEEARKLMVEKDSIWAAHRAILVKGLAKHDPFSIEYAPLATAISEYEAAVKAGEEKEDAMIEAIANLDAALQPLAGKNYEKNKENHGTDDYIDLHDSTQVIVALAAYAKARDEYFGYTYSKTRDAHNYANFRRGIGVDPFSGDPEVDSTKKFSELTYAELFKHLYDMDPALGDVHYGGVDKPQAGLANIMDQLLGSTYGAAIQSTNIQAADIQVKDKNLSFYGGLYTYDATQKKFLNKNGTDFVPAASTSKKTAVKNAAKAYVDAFNGFWAQGVTLAGTEFDTYFATVVADPTDAAAIKTAKENAITAVEALIVPAYDPECYTKATFKPYGDDEPIVTFSKGVVDTTVAMKAILSSVDPLAKAETAWAGSFEDQTAIFKDKGTDFWKACEAEYNYWVLTNTKVKDNLKEIKDWIDAVEAAFVADAEQAGEDDPDAYEQWAEDYAGAVALADSIANYAEALATYTGVDEDGNANGIFTPVLDYSTLDKFFNQSTEALTFVLAERSSLFDEFTGEWAEKLGGAQLALAKVLFPEAPAELMEWEYAYAEINDDIKHAEILYNSFEQAYLAAAKAAEYTDKSYPTATIDTLYNDLQAKLNAYITNLNNKIAADDTKIQTNSKKIADFWSEVPVIDIAIAEAEVDLAEAETKYNAAVTALDYAKANLQRVMDYMKSLDANFLNGSELEFPWNATTTGGSTTGGSTTGGSTWPSFPWTI